MLVPVRDNVVIKQLEGVAETEGGIVIPDQHVEKPFRGLVLAVGPDAFEVVVGDTVVYGKYSGTEIEEDKEVFVILCQLDILAISRPLSGSVPIVASSFPRLASTSTETKQGEGD